MLRWVILAVYGFTLVAVMGGYSLVSGHRLLIGGGFSWGLRTLRREGFSSCDFRDLGSLGDSVITGSWAQPL